MLEYAFSIMVLCFLEYGTWKINFLLVCLSFYGAGKFQDAECIIQDSFQSEVALDTVAYNTYIKSMLESGQVTEHGGFTFCSGKKSV